VAPAPDTPTQVISTAQTAVEMETLRSLERRLREAVEKGDLTAAELELTLARKRHGDSVTFSRVMDPLMARIAEIRKAWEEERQRSERLAGLVERARALRDEQNLDEARIALTAALDLDPKNQEVQSLLRSVDEAIEKKRHEEREREAAKAAAARVEQLLREGQFERAEEALGEALHRHGERDPLPAARKLLLQKQAERRDAAVKDRLARASALEQAHRPAEAQEILREALQIHPENQEVKKFLARVTASIQKQVDEERRARNVEAAAESVEQLIGTGDLRGAATLLSRHERELGAEAFRPLRQRLKEEERRAREATVRVPVAPPPGATPPAAPAPPVTFRPQPAPKPPGPGPSLGLWLGIGGVAAVLVVGGGAWLMLRNRPEPVPADVTPAPTSPPTSLPTTIPTGAPTPPPPGPDVAAGSGVLALDALPWAEVVEVTDATGKKWPLPASHFTPMSLSLPAGEYSVTLRNPRAGGTVTRKTRVRAAQSEPLLVELRRVDAEDYLRRAGF
jgi:tetratricopeptide (TPR) repeat protein